MENKRQSKDVSHWAINLPIKPTQHINMFKAQQLPNSQTQDFEYEPKKGYEIDADSSEEFLTEYTSYPPSRKLSLIEITTPNSQDKLREKRPPRVSIRNFEQSRSIFGSEERLQHNQQEILARFDSILGFSSVKKWQTPKSEISTQSLRLSAQSNTTNINSQISDKELRQETNRNTILNSEANQIEFYQNIPEKIQHPFQISEQEIQFENGLEDTKSSSQQQIQQKIQQETRPQLPVMKRKMIQRSDYQRMKKYPKRNRTKPVNRWRNETVLYNQEGFIEGVLVLQQEKEITRKPKRRKKQPTQRQSFSYRPNHFPIQDWRIEQNLLVIDQTEEAIMLEIHLKPGEQFFHQEFSSYRIIYGAIERSEINSLCVQIDDRQVFRHSQGGVFKAEKNQSFKIKNESLRLTAKIKLHIHKN